MSQEIINDKEQNFLNETVSKRDPNDKILLATNMEISNDAGKKWRKKLICATMYRLIIAIKSGGLKGKLGVEKDFHILEITSISGSSSEITIDAVGISLVLRSNQCSNLVATLRESFNAITFGMPQRLSFTLNIPPDQLLPIKKQPKVGIAAGFINAYIAYSNLRSVTHNNEVCTYISDIVASKGYQLDLTSFPGIDIKSELFVDLYPMCDALQHNVYFRSFEIYDQYYKDAAELVSIIVKHNRTMSYINISNTGADIPDQLGNNLAQNTWNRIQVFDFSGTKFRESSIISFSCALQKMSHGVKIINLDGSIPTARGTAVFLKSLQLNMGMAMTLECLNISNNKMDVEASSILLDISRDISKGGKMQRLSIANSGVNVGALMASRLLVQLHYLDISDNRFEKVQVDNLYALAPDYREFKSLKFSGLGLPSEIICKFLRELLANKYISDIALDLSRNSFAQTGGQLADEFKGSLKSTVWIYVLDLTDIGIKPKAAKDLLLALPQSLTKLILDENFSSSNPEVEEMSQALGVFINNHPNLTSLSICGDKRHGMGKKIAPFFDYLAQNATLRELNVSNNNMGNTTFASLCNALRSNKSLLWLKAHKNGLTLNGLLKLQQLLRVNKVLCVDMLLEEAPKDPRGSAVFNEIFHLLYSRKSYEPSPDYFTFKTGPIVAPEGPPPPLAHIDIIDTSTEYRHSSGLTVNFGEPPKPYMEEERPDENAENEEIQEERVPTKTSSSGNLLSSSTKSNKNFHASRPKPNKKPSSPTLGSKKSPKTVKSPQSEESSKPPKISLSNIPSTSIEESSHDINVKIIPTDTTEYTTNSTPSLEKSQTSPRNTPPTSTEEQNTPIEVPYEIINNSGSLQEDSDIPRNTPTEEQNIPIEVPYEIKNSPMNDPIPIEENSGITNNSNTLTNPDVTGDQDNFYIVGEKKTDGSE